MTIQQQCAERIYELLPEKKELSFGCEVKPTYVGREDYGYNGVYILGHNGYYNKANSSTEALHYEPLDAGLFEIIGHPIRLADILRAIAKISRPLPELKLFSVQLDISKRGTYGRDNCLYNLSKDNLLEQSDDTAQFIYDIISNRKENRQKKNKASGY